VGCCTFVLHSLRSVRLFTVKQILTNTNMNPPGHQSAPFNLIGANGFAGQDHCSRVCAAQHRRAEGAPLTVILNGKRILGTVGRATCTDRLSAVPETA
jgi:hypothetical protein